MNDEEFLGALKPGDVILVSNRGFDVGDKFIRLATSYKRGPLERQWGHVCAYLGNDTLIESFPGKGVVLSSLKNEYLGNHRHSLLAVRRKSLSGEQLNRFLDFFRKQVGDKYSLRALIYFPLYMLLPFWLQWLLDFPAVEKLFSVGGRYFCSELVASGLQETVDYCLENPPARVMPVDFKNPLIFETIGEYDIQNNTWDEVVGIIVYSAILILLGLGFLWTIHRIFVWVGI